MGRAEIKQLKHRDPDQRKVAIKRVARAVDRNALVHLAIMSKDDRDPEVRKLALRAGIYIREQLGEIPSSKENQEEDKSDKPNKIYVTDDNAAAARSALGEAMSAQINNDQPKMLKALEKAYQLDPNLRHDGYFINLLEQATGEDGEAGLKRLGDDDHYQELMSSQTQHRMSEEIAAHMDKVSKATWADVGFDIAVLFIITTIGAIISYFLLIEGANRYQNSLDENLAMVMLARVEGRIVPEGALEDAAPVTYYETRDAGGNYQGLFSRTQPDPAFMMTVDRLREDTSIQDVLTLGVAVGVSVPLAIFVMGLAAHILGRFLMRGQGVMTHTLHSLLALFTNRVVLLLMLIFAGSIVVFMMGGGMALTAFMGISGLFALFVLLKVMTTIGDAYNFSPAQGLIAALPGTLLLAGIAFSVLEYGVGFIDLV